MLLVFIHFTPRKQVTRFCPSQEFELRKHARQEGRRYCDPMVLTYQAERMPEQIRLKVRYTAFDSVTCSRLLRGCFVDMHLLD